MKTQLLLFGLCLLLVACGGSEPKPTENNPSDDTKTTASTVEDNTEENNLVAENTDLPEDLNPVTENNTKEPRSSTTTTNPTKNTTNNNTTPNTVTTENTNSNSNNNTEVKVNNPTKVNPPVKTETKNTKPLPLTLSHDDWHRMMSTYVNSAGQVNYAGLKREKGKIDAYLNQLGTHPPQNGWSRNKEMAYWINFYNAFTISLILEKYPNIKSITELEGGKVWMTRTILVAGRAYTLEQIEKDMLLRKFNEPRVHFAVVCAAKSCPPLLNAAWTEDNIQKNFDLRAKSFINNPTFNSIKTNSLELSKIFEWYAADFGNILDYLSKYSDTRISKGAKIKYKEYDWGLNKQ